MSIAKRAGIFPVFDNENRARLRAALSRKEIESIISLSSELRCRYFFRKIVDSHELWTAWDGDELPTYEGQFGNYIVIWSNKEYCDLYGARQIEVPLSTPIPVDDFINDILFNNNLSWQINVGIFPLDSDKPFIVMSASDFLLELKSEWLTRAGAGVDPGDFSIGRVIKRNMKEITKFGPKGKIPF